MPKIKITESKFRKKVADFLTKRGWLVAYNHTTFTGKGKGFPDLNAVRNGIIMYIELKVGYGKLSPEQEIWRDEIRKSVAIWMELRPEGFDTFKRRYNK